MYLTLIWLYKRIIRADDEIVVETNERIVVETAMTYISSFAIVVGFE